MRFGSRWMVALLFVLLALPLGSSRSSRAAGGADPSEKLIARGLELRRLGKDKEALEQFQEAYSLSRGARALAQIALAEQALGTWIDAELHLKQALKSQGDAWIRAHLTILEGALSVIQRRLGSLEITGSVVGAEVRVNGRIVGTLPLAEPARVTAGSAVIDVSAEGYWPASQTVIVPATGLARETINLVERKAEGSASLTTGAPAPSAGDSEGEKSPPAVSTAEIPEAHVRARDPRRDNGEREQSGRASEAPPLVTEVIQTGRRREEGGDSLTLWGYVSAGGAVAGLTTGIIALVIRNDHFTRYNDDSVCLENGRTRRENCGAQRDAGETAQTWSAVGFVSGGLMAAASAGMFLLAAPGSGSGNGSAPGSEWNAGGRSSGWATRSLAWSGCGVGPGQVGIACGGRFAW